MSHWSHPVAGFWAGEDLSFVEQMVIRSYLEQGCDFTLYLGHSVGGIPEGTPVREATEILPRPGFLSPEPTRKQLAVWSDLFRIRLLQSQQVIWADLDAYCVRPYDLPSDHGFGHNGTGGILSGVLALPQDSAALRWMSDFLDQDEIAPPWSDPAWVERRRKQGTLGVADLPWGDTGPRMLAHALRISGEDRFALPPEVFYPLLPNTLQRLWRPGGSDAFIRPETLSVHIFGYTKRVLATHWQGLPPPGSWLARMAERHGIDPRAAPATGLPLPPR
ncbi:hypothetical protein [Paracoccus zhejiangensis]|uniref:Alpha 1,4-glycosyltransferase domain-containing protein n=1 Tax=Paracoccus zhejiangensis TaxID=1077935 RepID=A0A2H5F1A8_9RHOB|nr:hypothetical protein [Paracoccus zhejiangensis]AUH65331.1 hypothetical protein CX676_15120 [Paracoccus zhejiangensis]